MSREMMRPMIGRMDNSGMDGMCENNRCMPPEPEKYITMKEYLLGKYEADFLVWLKEMKGASEFNDFMNLEIVPSFKERCDMLMMNLFTLYQQHKIIGTARDIARIGMNVFKR